MYMPDIRYQGDMKVIAVNRMKQAAERISHDLAKLRSNF
jgi:hypothetical protein